MKYKAGQRVAHSMATLEVFGLLLLSLMPLSGQAQDEEATVTHDGLVLVEDTDVHAAFIDPDADFSVFRRVAVLRPDVAFRSDWQRRQNRSSRSRNVRASDVERIQEDVADLFKEVFVEGLEAAGYEVVNYADEDVLILRPTILDLDVTAPDVRSAGRSSTYTATTGAATLLLELFDSMTGDIVGRAIDRRSAGRSGGFATRSNRVTNRTDARREFRVWADKLIEFLDQHYLESSPGE